MPKIPIKYSLFIFFSLPLYLLAQNLDQVLDLGNELAEKKDYFGAAAIYQTAMNIDSSNAEVLYRYGVNLSNLNNPQKASRYLYKSYLLEADEVHPELSYQLAESYRNAGEYRTSRRYYSKAMRPYRRDKKSYWYKRINQSKRAASWAEKNQKALNDNPVENLSSTANSDASEFGGIIHNNTLYFSALLADSMGKNQEVYDTDYFNAIYSLAIEEGSKPEKIEFKGAAPFAKKHLANLSFGKEKEVYFTVCDSSYNCEIWMGELEGQRISKASKLNNNINSKGFNNTQPHWFEIDNTEYLIFSSNREKGFGGLDLWLSKKESYGFDKAKNLGATINSPDDEITPYYNAKNKTLYFSSNWHEGLGGFDLFSAKGGPLNYDQLMNLGAPINSSYDDYYFYPIEGKALFTSNRPLGNVDAGSSCCNDLFATEFEEDLFEETDPEKMEVSVDVLNKYLPLDLYFHNDSPDPNNRDTSTRENYLNLAKRYRLMQTEYSNKYLSLFPDSTADDAAYEIESFFIDEVEAGIKSLEFFSPLLYRELEKGSQIELTIKGYASSLSSSDYNLNLTLRRIHSLINYLKDYEGGKLLPYLNNTASNGGSLSIQKLPFGEFAVESDAIEANKIMAVYSPQASRQRKIEVLAVTKSGSGKQSIDGSDPNEQAELSIAKKEWDLGEIDQQADQSLAIEIQNTGNAAMKIFTVNDNCDCVSIKYPRTLSAGEKGNLQVAFDFEKVKGKVKVVLSVFSSTNPNIHEITVEFTNP